MQIYCASSQLLLLRCYYCWFLSACACVMLLGPDGFFFYVFKANGSPPMGSAKATRQKGQPAAPEWHALAGKHQLINFTGQLNPAPNKSDEHDKQKTAGHKNDRTSTAKHNEKKTDEQKAM